MPQVEFTYHTGVPQRLFDNVRLCGSWDDQGRASDSWSTLPMQEFVGDDGCPAFRATATFPPSSTGTALAWGVIVDGPNARDQWGIPTETADISTVARHRSFVVGERPAQHYWLTTSRLLGANPRLREDGSSYLQFSVWAPHARDVAVVFGDPVSGYIADDGSGVVGDPIPLARDDQGLWHSDPDEKRLADVTALDHRPYMYRVVKDGGQVAFRTDLYSRCQIGRGRDDPARLPPGERFSGRREDLDGTVGCSVVVDPARVTRQFAEPTWPETDWVDEQEFWREEFDPRRPVPSRPEDLIIYELHVGGLGAGRVDAAGTPVPGTLADVIALLDHLVALGINAIELLPMSEFEGWMSWGYGTSHYFAVEFSGGGRDQLKHVVRACHRRGIAVILDVVYNHFHHQAERAEWAFDSDAPQRNQYYWYEGSPDDYPDPTGGYLDNWSTGWAPRLHEERVRQLFVSSAVVAAVEFHVDGFRVDQTTSLHAYNTLHADGRAAAAANAFGAKLLRELTATLTLVKPTLVLIAEDHSGWDGVTRPPELGGFGFDLSWYSEFYHHLNGDTGRGPDCANLLTTAAIGDNRPLAMGYFAGALSETANAKVVYHESHDEAGNSSYPGGTSGRTIAIAVGRAPLIGQTHRYAQARVRFAFGAAMLSAGTPMFFMGEEVGAQEDYRYDDYAWHRPDLEQAARTTGASLFGFCRSLITLRRTIPTLRYGWLSVVHVDDASRVLAFERGYGWDRLLVVASLNDRPFSSGYTVHGTSGGAWREIFNSDAALFGGWNEGNRGGTVRARGPELTVVVPRAGFVVFRRAADEGGS